MILLKSPFIPRTLPYIGETVLDDRDVVEAARRINMRSHRVIRLLITLFVFSPFSGNVCPAAEPERRNGTSSFRATP